MARGLVREVHPNLVSRPTIHPSSERGMYVYGYKRPGEGKIRLLEIPAGTEKESLDLTPEMIGKGYLRYGLVSFTEVHLK